MSIVLVYVDHVLAIQLATGLIGSEVKLSDARGSAIGVNFKVILSQERKTERSTTTRTADLLPELLADAVHLAINDRIDSLSSARARLVAGSDKSFRPGAPVIISNCHISLESKGDAVLSGEHCMSYRLKVGEFYLKCYLPSSSGNLADSLADQPIEVVGILRYTEPYTIPGAISLNLGLRICAIWLR